MKGGGVMDDIRDGYEDEINEVESMTYEECKGIVRKSFREDRKAGIKPHIILANS